MMMMMELKLGNIERVLKRRRRRKRQSKCVVGKWNNRERVTKNKNKKM